jgi:hypothetical protein
VSPIARALAAEIHAALATSPVVAITGPRTAGKSTLAHTLVEERGGTFVDLDDPAVRALAEGDPAAFVVGRPEPVVVDEFQRVPLLLSAMKAQLNRDRRPGRYVLTGSARPTVVPELADFLTGRVELLTLWPFAEAELSQTPVTFVDRLFSGDVVGARPASITRTDLVDLVLRGGYPIAVSLEERARRRWFANLASLVIERLDVPITGDSGSATRFLRLLAARTGQVVSAAETGAGIGLGREAAAAQMSLLEATYLVLRLPAWSVNLSSRETKRPKVHLVDSGLAAALQGATPATLAPTDPAGATRFGALLETFAVTEIVKQIGWSRERVVPYHFRTSDGAEVDLVLEHEDGRVAAVEVKAGSLVGPAATRGLRYLRDRVGDRFVAGVLLSSGEHAARVDDRILTAPVSALWRT